MILLIFFYSQIGICIRITYPYLTNTDLLGSETLLSRWPGKLRFNDLHFLNMTLFSYFDDRLKLVRRSHLTLDVAGAIAGAENLTKYDSVDADVGQSYSEYSLASLLYNTKKVGNLDYLTLSSVLFLG